MNIKTIFFKRENYISRIERREYKNVYAYVKFENGVKQIYDCRVCPEWFFAHNGQSVVIDNDSYLLHSNKTSAPKCKIVHLSYTLEEEGILGEKKQKIGILYLLLDNGDALRINLQKNLELRNLKLGKYIYLKR